MITDQELAVKIAKLLLQINANVFRFDPPFTYTTGMKSPVYLDNRVILSYPDVRKKIINGYVKVIKKEIGVKNIDYISATAMSAIPQGAWISEALNLPMVYVRPKAKMHGRERKVEGYFKDGSRVLIVEDHITTAQSLIHNVESIRELGGIVKYAVATTTYQTDIASKNLKDNKIKLFPLTTGEIIVQTAFKKGEISEKEKDSVIYWLKDPKNWAKKMGFE